ncbi:odorant receptor Or1-like [Prorops nasuta]|uniref:odorant receptor Or1-like n=1 Tax=Prorops nasuta TaxID=863751 RepID=UPI0034CFB881
MDPFSTSYYKLQKTLFSICGAWPYQNNRISIILRITFITLTLVFLLIPEVLSLLKNLEDFDFIMTMLPMLSGSVMGFSKGLIIFGYNDEVKKLMDGLQKDWQDLCYEESELLIIKRYAKAGRLITIILAVSIFMAAFSVYLVSCIAPVMDLILPLNESRNYELIFPGDFYVHTDRYFFLFLTLEFSALVCIAHLIVTVDSWYMVLTLHCCGLFVVLSQRLEKLSVRTFKAKRYQVMPENTVINEDRMIYSSLKKCIQLHLRSIKYGEQINSMFNVSLFVDVTAGIFIASASAVKFVLSTKDTGQRIKYGSIYITQTGRIFFNTLPGQLIYDHSSQVYLAASQSKWYELPEKSKKMLIMIMMRSLKPCEYVVAGMFSLNIELFSMVTRTCLSYCTIMLSTQN